MFCAFHGIRKTPKSKKALLLNKTLLREHYMKMKKLLSELFTLLKYVRNATAEKHCCEPLKSCGHTHRKDCGIKKVPLKALLLFLFFPL